MKTNPEVLALRSLIRDHEAQQKSRRKTKKNTTPTNSLTNRIIDYIQDQGGHAIRVNVAGYYREDIKKWIPSGSTLGVSDIIAIRPGSGRFVGLEVKAVGEAQSDKQKLQERKTKRAGGEYYIVRSWEGFLQVWANVV